MRILHVLDHSVPLHSGYAFRTLAIIREQRRLGWQTAHITSTKHEASAAELPGYRPPGRAGASQIVDGLEFHRTPRPSALIERAPLLGQWSAVTTLRHRLPEVIAAFRPDVLHAHSPSLNGLATMTTARRYRLPFVYELRASWEDAAVDHGTMREGGLRYTVSRRVETTVLRRATAIVTICEGLRRDIASRGIDESLITVVPNAVDLETFSAASADPELADRLGVGGCRVLGFIGSFYAYEGLALLLEALPMVLARWPKTKLLLVGGGYQDTALRQRVAEQGLGDHVIFTGRVPHDRVLAYYDVIDVLVYPRLSMRLTELVTPLKPLEAMAYRRLVVASDVGGHAELIRDGRTGLLFRAGDAAALAARVGDALELGDRAHVIRAAARRFVESERSWPTVVSRYRSVYESACSRHR